VTGNYYDLLGCAQDADATAIKRAFYTRVKQVPPERFPDEYKAVRTAWDVLSNPGKRARYDRKLSLPEGEELPDDKEDSGWGSPDGISRMLAQTFFDLSNLCEQMLAENPDIQRGQVSIPQLAEKLCELHPDNAWYSLFLAMQYRKLGEKEKCLAWFEHTVRLDDSKGESWLALMEFLTEQKDRARIIDTAKRALQALKDRAAENFKLFVCSVMILQEEDLEIVRDGLGGIASALRSGAECSAPDWDLLIQMTEKITQDDPGIAALNQEIISLLNQDIHSKSKLKHEISMLEDDYSPDITFLAGLFLDEDVDVSTQALYEKDLLESADDLRPEILRLRRDHPDVYALHGKFFDEVLRTRNTGNMIKQREEILNRYGMPEDDDWDFDDDEEPEERWSRGPSSRSDATTPVPAVC